MKNEDLEDSVHRLDFYIRRNTRYHMRRSSFFSFLSRTTAFVGVVFGSAAAATLLTQQDPRIVAGMALIVVLMNALNLVIGTEALIWLHNDLRRRYVEIDAELAACESPDTAFIKGLWARIKRIEADEPPVMHALELVAYDDAVRAVYSREEAKAHLSSLNAFQRMTAQIWPWDTLKA